MNILMVLSDNTYPPDIRVKKEARSLIDAGHRVFLICRRGANQAKNEVVDGIHVYRIDLPFSSIPLIFPFLYLTIYRFIIIPYILSIVKKHKIDVLHVHDLPYALATCIVGKIIKKPVIFDMHEDYIAMMLYTSKHKFIIRILSKILEVEEKIALKMSTKIIVVVEEEIGRLVKLGVPTQKIVVIHNTEDPNELDKLQSSIPDFSEQFRDKFVITYIGGFSRHRGLDVLIKAMPLILDEIPNAHLLLVGDGVMKDHLVKMCEKIGIEDKVTFTGWVSFEEALGYLKISNVCVIPYHKTRQTNKSFPHKLSQYMYFGKPIVVSDVDSLKRIVEETGCGIIFKAGDHEDLAKKIIEVKKHNLLKELGEKAREAFERKYNWNNTSKKLIELYSILS